MARPGREGCVNNERRVKEVCDLVMSFKSPVTERGQDRGINVGLVGDMI